jgi:hypothetical protein
MRAILRATVVILSLASVGSAYAENEGGAQVNTQSTEVPGVVVQAPTQNVIPVETAGSGDSRSGHGPWLFPPIGKYLDQQAAG